MHIPLSGRNPALNEVLGIRPHLLVLNKMDLADLTHKSVSRVLPVFPLTQMLQAAPGFEKRPNKNKGGGVVLLD